MGLDERIRNFWRLKGKTQVFWSRKLKSYVDKKDNPVKLKQIGPDAEIEYWRQYFQRWQHDDGPAGGSFSDGGPEDINLRMDFPKELADQATHYRFGERRITNSPNRPTFDEERWISHSGYQNVRFFVEEK